MAKKVTLHKVDPQKPVYVKACKKCGGKYETNSRGSRFCSPEHGVEYRKATKKRREQYAMDNYKAIIKVQAHKLGVKVLEYTSPEKKCIVCEKNSDEIEIECHHINGNYLDNRPSNLEWRCKSHHAEADSARKKASKKLV